MNEISEQNKENREKKVGNVLKYFNLIMGVFYVVAGLLIYFYPPNALQVSNNTKLVICFALVLYGSFRVYRIIKANA